MHASTTPGEAATASVPPAPENATKEEVIKALKGVLMEVAVKTGEEVANALIKLLRHESLDTSLLKGSIESVRQIREEANDDGRHWLEHIQFEKVTIYDPKDPSTSGVAWFRCPIEPLKCQVSKAGKGGVYYDPFVEVNRAGTRIYNHAMGCKLMEEVMPLIRESIIGEVRGGFWLDRFSFVGAIQAYSDKSCQTLKAGSHTFLPLHLSTLNLTQALRQSLVSNCDTVVAYLPVEIVRVETQEGDESVYQDDEEFGDEGDDRATAGTKTSRRERRKSKQGLLQKSKQRLLQKSIEVALKPL
jgi:hypothetical protein